MYVLRGENFHQKYPELPCYRWLDLYLYQAKAVEDGLLFNMNMFEVDFVSMKPSFQKISDLIGVIDEVPMYVLTNEDRNNGAAIAANPIVLEAVGETLGGDFFLLPSSVHEFLVVPRDDGMVEDLLRTIREINMNEVPEEEFLSDSLYMYSIEKKSIAVFHK